MTNVTAPKRSGMTLEDYERGILEGNRTILARAITLVESNAPAHQPLAEALIQKMLPRSGKSIRVGITGVPGVGKSTFIESLGCYLCRQGHKIAVLAVDPSSPVSHGSVLGDKTRMEELSREPNAFIRPSPAAGTLGGVARKSRESLLLCEAFGFDVILVETVGVGQSETTVRSMVDFFLLLLLAGAGDELQGIKKGVVELADALVVTKADGDNKLRAETARAEHSRVLHYLAPATHGWKTEAYTCSSVEGRGVADIWQVICKFRESMTTSGMLDYRRQTQDLAWMKSLIDECLRERFYRHPYVAQEMPLLEQKVARGQLSAVHAVQTLFQQVDANTSLQGGR